MNTNIKKELNHILMDEYMTLITNKCLHNFKISNNTYKIDNDKIIIPTIYNFNEITKYNYNVNQLKLFAKQYILIYIFHRILLKFNLILEEFLLKNINIYVVLH